MSGGLKARCSMVVARAENVMCRPYGTRLIFVHIPRTSVLGYPLAPLRGWVILASRSLTYAVGFIPSPKGMSSAMLSSRNAAGPKVLIGGGAGTFFFFLLLLFERRGRRFRTHIHRVEEGHHAAQACAHFFEQLVLLTVAHRIEPGTTLLVFRYPLAGVSAVADFIQNMAHFGTRLVGDNARAAGVVAVLGGITHRVAHVIEATAIDEINDQLQLVEALEVCDLGLIARLHERLESGLDERAHAAA